MGYGSVHSQPPAWLAARFAEAEARVASRGWKGPQTSPELVRGFLHETYEHIREVNALIEALGGKARPIPTTNPGEIVRGVHDFGERVSTTRFERFVEEVKRNPLKSFDTGKPIPPPAWLDTLLAEAKARGQRSIDVGKLSPYVAAGLAQAGKPDRYSIELHRLSPHHHQDGLKGNLLKEAIADRINAMRQVRVYSKQPMPFEKIERILKGDLGKSLPADAKPLVEQALATQKQLERTRRVNPYYLLESQELRAKVDRWDRFRRADGTLDWKKAGRAGALQAGGGLAHFGLALFLKELAAAAKTGDRARLEEFFDGLLQTDFYVHYGLFALGAAASDVAYSRYLQRYVKPRFVSSVLRTNLALATGMALPQIVAGEFEGKPFAISLVSLGLSATAVQAGVRGLSWVRELRRARQGSALAQAGRTASRLGRIGGWTYTVAETAVVLYLAEEVEDRLNAWLERDAALDALADAGEELTRALGDGDATPESVRAAAERHHAAWSDYRDFLYRPLSEADALLGARLERIAAEAKQDQDSLSAFRSRSESSPALRQRLEARYGSLDEYLARRERKLDQEHQASVSRALASYEDARRQALSEIYTTGQESELRAKLDELDHREWLLTGAREQSAVDPHGARSDLMARLGRGRLRSSLRDALREASPGRLTSYADEQALLSHAVAVLQAQGRGDLAAPLRELAERVEAEQDLDRETFLGEGAVLKGAADALRR